MHINIDEVSEIKEIPTKEFNVYHINQIKNLYKEVRESSKTPTFPFDLHGY